MKNSQLISIVIVTWNSSATIEKCLRSFEASSKVEITVVDNNSSDNTVALVEKFPWLKLVKNKVNQGFGQAINLGIESNQHEFVFLLNPDTEVEKGTPELLKKYLLKHQQVGVVGPKLLNGDGSVQGEIALFPTLLSQVLILLRLHRFGLSNLVYPKLDYSKTQEVEHLMGAALLIRRSVFEEVGGFDEKFFLWFEETDLLKRIQEKGYKIMYYPEATVTHLVGQSTKQLNFLKKQTIWNKSLLYYFKKRKDWITILLLLPFIVLSYPAALISYLIKK